MATAWKPDAALVGIFAKLEADGTIDPRHLAAPPNFDGGMLSLNYFSPSAMQMLSVTLSPSSKMEAGPPLPGGFGVPQIPIDGNFLDLDEVLVQAKSKGLVAPRTGFIDARVTGVENVSGGPNPSLWSLTAVDTSGAFPVPGQVVQFEAQSGRQTDFDTASGRKDRDALIAELIAGRRFSPPLPPTFDAFRQEADAWAARWNKDLQLFEADVRLSYASQQLQMKSAAFRYFVAAPVRADLRDMLNSPQVDEKSKQAVREMLATPDVLVTTVQVDRQHVRIGLLEDVHPGGSYRPRALPDGFVPLEEAMRRFAAMDLGTAAEDLQLLLYLHGLYAEGHKRPDDGSGAGDDPPDLPRDTWYWRTVAMRMQKIESSGERLRFTGERPTPVYVHVQAVK